MTTKEERKTMNHSMGASTDEARRIAQLSQQIIGGIVADNSPEGSIKQRVVMATGNPQFIDLLRFCHHPTETGVAAIRRGAKVYVDINMVRIGISKDIQRLGGRVICELPDSDASSDQELTRASAGLLKSRNGLKDAIVVIGNAPSAAMTLTSMVNEGCKPALIVATPVGFVNAARSKELIRGLTIPSITTVGTQGGTPVAVAVVNGLIAMALQ
ncbi:MAG: precorrin-8X methylmutase [Halobacteriota archaeon]